MHVHDSLETRFDQTLVSHENFVLLLFLHTPFYFEIALKMVGNSRKGTVDRFTLLVTRCVVVNNLALDLFASKRWKAVSNLLRSGIDSETWNRLYIESSCRAMLQTGRLVTD